MQVITAQQIVQETLTNMLIEFKERQAKFQLIVNPTSDLHELPSQAFVEGFVLMEFDYGAENNWTAEQINVENGFMSCCLVYLVDNDWKEYWVKFPLINVLQVNSEFNLNELFDSQTVMHSLEFQKKINFSKTKLRLL